MHLILQVSTSLVQERVVSPSCLPLALEATLAPREIQRFLDATINDEESAMGEDEATLHVATVLAKDFGYSLEVRVFGSLSCTVFVD